MIPGIEEILHMLLSGQCTQSEALNWINRHIEMASENDALRDHFAGLAMQGILAQACGTALGSDPRYAAEHAYLVADAMFEARTS